MLLELSIKDFAIIDHLKLRLHRLFNVFTGETGAGKSIIIDAVNALLGGKIRAEFVRAGCERATVEGVFSVETLPPVKDEWLQMTAMAPVGVQTLFDVPTNGHYQGSENGDANTADASAALAALLHEYDITPEDGQLILT